MIELDGDAEYAEPQQISLGPSGHMFTPYEMVRGMVRCPSCGDLYLTWSISRHRKGITVLAKPNYTNRLRSIQAPERSSGSRIEQGAEQAGSRPGTGKSRPRSARRNEGNTGQRRSAGS